MRLTSLTLQGFKSFGNRTAVEFAPGVTAIIGPNGSGKSNLIDALKWTSGGGRAREFRASDKTDLIFHGAAGKRSLGLAEVEVELSQGGRSLKLYRSLDREGTTRLRLNGRNARFLDLEEALAGSGLGRSGLAIIGQGEVSQVLMADPPKLLAYVAEAAGVARMSTRREQTQDRLDTARSHLARLEDVLAELESRATALAEEAAEAERHANLSAESLRLRVTVAQARVDTLESDIASLRSRQGALEAGLAEGRDTLAQTREGLEGSRRERDAAEERYRRAMAEAEARRGDLRVAEERAAAAEQRRASVETALLAARAEADRLDAEEPPQAPEGDPGPWRAEEEAAAAALVALEAELEQARAHATEARRALERIQHQRTEQERTWARFESRRQELDHQVNDGRERLAALDAEPGPDLEALTRDAERAARTAEARDREVEGAREAVAREHRRHAQAEAEAMALERAAGRQRAAFEARRGYAQGPRNALTSGIAGVIGSVADLIRVPERFQVAVSAALGRRAEYVVVDTAETGERVLAHVRRAGGFVTVLPLDLLEAGRGPLPDALLRRPGVVGRATDLVEADAAYATLVSQLLGGTLLMQTMGHATALARSGGPRPRMVTLEGDIQEASGAMSGGRRGPQAGVLGAAAELEEAEAAADRARAQADAALEVLTRVQDTLRHAEEGAHEARAARDRTRAALAQARERASGREHLRSDLRQRLEAAEAARAALAQPPRDVDEGDEQQRERDAAAAEDAVEALRVREAALRRGHADARQQRSVLEERWRAYRAARERYEQQRVRAAELRTESGRLEHALQEAEREARDAHEAREAARAALPNDVEREEAALLRAREASDALERRLTHATEEQAARSQELEECKLQSARRETALELAVEELRQFPDGVERLETGERAARARLREVTEALEALGPVNHRAARDLRETRERKETLEVEAVQAALAVSELEGTLARIDRETTARLTEALTRLRASFGRHVAQLFGGDGRGDIEVDREEGRPIGVRIKLQPPGKQTQSLHLLSVGERTMGALAFLFALMADPDAGGGLPIAVLDEVDAPLDEANIRRYCSFLRRLAEAGTQFVLITHQKATFEVADVLWGVTTEEGVSRVFSIRREDAAAAS